MSTCNPAAKKMPLLSTSCSSTKNMSLKSTSYPPANKISLLPTGNSPAKEGGGSEKNANSNKRSAAGQLLSKKACFNNEFLSAKIVCVHWISKGVLR
ncbi:hypothetical protein JTE90_007396 [Oedothorax gibbosus]|uniref:Uncharacterized protein n=1 Tax=Oedothorax gibbosus TaxID=931172 RepID=A0AAV6TV95_9ARAC|nr:hypothetical protein JTE90_007396 [Oedothorax gibbosus]